jgi:hypothetical protein
VRRMTRIGPLLLSLIVLCVAPGGAGAVLTIEPGDTPLEIVDTGGEPETRAGAHPDRLIQGVTVTDLGGAVEYPRDFVLDLPPGLGGNPNAVPFCPRTLINNPLGGCPPASQVGTMVVEKPENKKPIYNVKPGPNEVATFVLLNIVPFYFSGHLRPADQGLTLRLENFPNEPFTTVAFPPGPMELWGIPADHLPGLSLPRRPLLTMATRCDLPPVASTISMRSWQQPERWFSAIGDSGQRLEGCGDLPFDPSFAFRFDDQRADAPSGAAIEVSLPQDEDPDGRGTPQIRDLSFTMPAGTTISPGGVHGLEACTDAQFGLGAAAADPTCPASSRVGTVELDVPALSGPMDGAVYLGAEHPGERFRLLVAASARGSVVKFTGSLDPDPATGRVTANLKNLPQASFERMSLRFGGGAGALLATPLSCGSVPTTARFTPYSTGAAVERSGTATVAAASGGPCAGPPPFAPDFVGGSTNPRAGRATSFTATIRRRDGEQLPQRLSIALPPGMGAALGKVSVCPGAQAAAAACPAASRIGKALAELGPGGAPASMAGDVFITGPYRGAPFGIALALKAGLGSFDLGTLVLRGTIQVDRLSNQVTVQMDALPTVFEGVPIRFQTIGLDLDRPNFLRNPTSCAPARMTATLRSVDGATATPSSPFAIRGCVDLPFRPAFSMALTDRAELRADGKPGMLISMGIPAGSANLRSAHIRFPRALKFAPDALKEVCARKQALRRNCPKGSRVGSASGRTPFLNEPMQGSVYIVQPRGSGSPDLWASLSGQGLEVNLRGETKVKEGQAEAKFVDIPDFPLASVKLRLDSGRSGLLQLRRKPCGGLVSPIEMDAQNSAQVEIQAPVAAPARCGRERGRKPARRLGGWSSYGQLWSKSLIG